MALSTPKPDTSKIWQWLEQVPDPEIPAISITDLGIIRDVKWDGDTLEVTVTPTYSGCPATTAINFSIEQALLENGVEKIRLKRQLSPAWTTDWLSETAHEKLRKYGIAPPVAGTATCGIGSAIKVGVNCPRCNSANTERVSQFGSTPCKANYRCKDCLEPFDYFKCH